MILCFFFFQAEDGIRDATVTGVQTCALPIGDHGRIHVPDPEALRLQPPPALCKKVETADPLVPRIIHPKVVADVSLARGPQHRIDHGMGEDIGVRVTVESLFERDLDSPENQWAAGDQGMNVVADADPDPAPSRRLRITSARSRSSAVVILMFSGSPGTTLTLTPSRSTSMASSAPRD